MDNVYHYQIQKGKVGHLQSVINQDKNLQFYSEDELDNKETPKIHNQTKPKLSSFGSMGYQSDYDSDSTPKEDKKNKNLCKLLNLIIKKYELQIFQIQATKMSKFRNLVNTKQIEGDVENEPDFDESDIKKPVVEEMKFQDEEDLYNIQEQEQRVRQKIKEQTNSKQQKNKQIVSQQQLAVNSDVEPKRSKQNKDDKLSNHPFRHLIFGPSTNEQTFKKYMILTQRGLIYAKKCLKGPSDKFIKSKQVILPEAHGGKKEKTLVLDLDETLIHSCPYRENPQVYVTAIGDYGEEAKIGINVRPYCAMFLQKLSQYYTIYIYTASSAAYANAIIGYLDPKKQYIAGILTRQNCMETKNGFFIKDLRIIANKQLKDILIVDNLAHSFGFQIENGIPILEYHNDQNDVELKYLLDYLIEAARHDDLREYNKRLKLDQLIEYNLEQ